MCVCVCVCVCYVDSQHVNGTLFSSKHFGQSCICSLMQSKLLPKGATNITADMTTIMVAVIAIGLIGFLLDRIMLKIQQRVAWDQ